jgi:phosphoribosylanthranilate isomerase
MVRLKICGITNHRDAQLCVDSGADWLGFNFYARSPRYISPSQAHQIIRRLPRRIHAVGVFVNLSATQILQIARASDLTMVQLHGDENPRFLAQLANSYPVIKAFRVRSHSAPKELKRFAQAEAFLFDGFHPEFRGGAGARFDWRIARAASRYGRIILAGGLTPENLPTALKQARPFGIDVCSGVESSPGKKDPRKLKAFARAAGR